MTPDYDNYTIRLPAGRKAEVRLPTVFTQDDAERIKRWLDLIASNSMEDNRPSKESGDE